ncbi:ParA family protein [Rhizobium sp. S95]|uniref:ParA family protein n=1 Tax=Ciceribacter sichuanensis TaxID=2949647 RepID=A0AAJ1F6H9_9HYPH|nr:MULTISPECIES: ParA family protein [unclassified Ciceribacter]MCM2399042.1 ParA family protein [Ciceribacter sp. S95]MCM2402001.1 ParA family protein [Ciceribacter sp. S153]MCO5956752.1 ParA family protein [Ciceribacter sp. S101]
MPVISFANAKGGAGKTTAALLLATELAQQGYRVGILDADPQRWITQWHELSGPQHNIEVISEVTVASLQGHIRELARTADYTIIDLAGARDAIVTTAIGLSDHVMIPVQGCAMDARGGAQILDLIKLMEETGKLKIDHSVVLTRVTSMVTTRALLTIKGLLAARGVNVINTPIAERTAYREIFDCGGTLYSMDPTKISNLDKARENARLFAGEVMQLLPVRIVRSQQPRRLFKVVRSAA